MKTYKIFANPFNQYEAVKQGFSWPGLFFAGYWMLFKRMWSYAGMLFGGLFVFYFVLYAVGIPESSMVPLQSIINISLGVYCGQQGNNLREKYLLDHGYEFITTIEAPNPDLALAQYMSEKKTPAKED
jgi:hypothetical protein